MTSTLKEQIIKHMDAQNLSIAMLERKAGLSIHSVRNILNGRTKKPKAQSIQAITEALGCSILDLVSFSPSPDLEEIKIPEIKLKKNTLLKDPDLMRKCLETVIHLLKEKQC